MFKVTVENGGYTWYLRSTTWTSSEDRMSTFDTEDLAREALLRAKPFMKAALYKRAQVVPHQG